MQYFGRDIRTKRFETPRLKKGVNQSACPCPRPRFRLSIKPLTESVCSKLGLKGTAKLDVLDRRLYMRTVTPRAAPKELRACAPCAVPLNP